MNTKPIEHSPSTYWNRRRGRLERRVLRNGRWVRPDQDSINLRRVIFGYAEPVPALDNQRAWITNALNSGVCLAYERKASYHLARGG